MGRRKVVVVLSLAEAEGLMTCADDGAEGLLTDPESARVYIGGPASVAACLRGLRKLSVAVVEARHLRQRNRARPKA